MTRHDINPRLTCNHPQVESVEEVREDAQTPNIKVTVSTSWPQSEIFGVKLINGHATEARLSFKNEEPTPVTVSLVGGTLLQDAGADSRILRNLTGQRYGLAIPGGEEQTVTYTFTTEMHPQDLRLQLVAVLQDSKQAFFTVSAFNETVTVVEAPIRVFDPQMYAFTRSAQPLGAITDSSVQHLPLPRPAGRLRWHRLLHLQHLDLHPLPPEASRRQGR